MSVLEDLDWVQATRQSVESIGSSDDCSGVGFWREVLDAVDLHSKFAVTCLKSSVERADQSLHDGWSSRDHA